MPPTPPPIQPPPAADDAPPVTEFDVWGCRGSRCLPTRRSRVGVRTSCYSARHGDALYVFDAGRGITELGAATEEGARLAGVRRVFILIGHAHIDHWDGLAHTDWFWRAQHDLAITVLGPIEALDAIRNCYREPTYVPLEVLARSTGMHLGWRPLHNGDACTIGEAQLFVRSLHHYSGSGPLKVHLDALGYRLRLPDGATIAYLSDHEPTEETRPSEDELIAGAHLAILDAHFSNARDHAFGHGSQESTAAIARRHPGATVLATHHGPNLTDEQIRASAARHGEGLENFHLAVEGETWRYDAAAARMLRRSNL